MSLAAVPRVQAAADAPIWAVGDNWAYAFLGSSGASTGTTLKYSVVGVERLTVQGTSYSVYHVQTWANDSGHPPGLYDDIWYRTSDLSVVRWTASYSVYGVTGWYNGSISATANPPAGLQFPLNPGRNWTATTAVTYKRTNTDNGSSTWLNATDPVTFSVGEVHSLHVPAGNFTVTPVTENRSGLAGVMDPTYLFDFYGHEVVSFSSDVGNFVETDYYVYLNITPGGAWHRIGGLALATYGHGAPSNLVGLPYWAWGVIVAAATIGLVIVFWRRREARVGPRRPMPPPRPPSGPP